MIEEWKDVIGYENLYKISNTGRLFSIRSNKILVTKKCSKGKYLQYCLSLNNKQKYLLAHRLVAIAFIPNPLNLPEINHKDSNTHNNNVDNLEWCNRSFNIVHSFREGNRIPVRLTRSQCHLSKLTEEETLEVIKLRKNKVPYKQISKAFGLSISGLEKIISKYKKETNGNMVFK